MSTSIAPIPSAASPRAIDSRRVNYSVKDDIRAYWTARAESFDRSPGHGIHSADERRAWHALIAVALGGTPAGMRVLELASGTGEITRVLSELGCRVTGIDLTEAMIVRARAKLREAGLVATLHLGDAESTMEPAQRYDAVLSRHLVWTLPDPAAAFADWRRVLRPGGRLVIIDGDWVTARRSAALRSWVARLLKRITGAKDPPIDYDAHRRIVEQVHFRAGASTRAVTNLLENCGLRILAVDDLAAVRAAQRRDGSLAYRLTMDNYASYVITAERPAG
jgi:ubiquinone/menaquinone biosynthesis C-methylase UbiE